MKEFFEHENNKFPPSISEFGKLRYPSNKSDIIPCIENLANVPDSDISLDCPEVTAFILDGAAIVHMLKPGTGKTFNDYSKKIFAPFIMERLKHVDRIDVVFDRYDPRSLKTHTRLARGTGQKVLVTPATRIPQQVRF